NTARWCAIDGVSGLVSRENLTSTIGEGVEKIDDGCVVLPELTPERRDAIREKLAKNSVTDEAAWSKFSGVGRDVPGAPLADVQSVNAYAAATHHDDIVRVDQRKQAKTQEAPVDLTQHPATDPREIVLTAETLRVSERLMFTEGTKDGRTFD